WTPERVGHDHADVDALSIADSLTDAASARVGIVGQKGDDVRLAGVRLVNSRVSAYEAVTGFGDQHALGSEDSHALVEDHLDEPRIWQRDQLLGDAFRLIAGDDRG